MAAIDIAEQAHTQLQRKGSHEGNLVVMELMERGEEPPSLKRWLVQGAPHVHHRVSTLLNGRLALQLT